MAKRKTTLLPSESLTGSAYTAAHADAADDFFRQLMAEAATDLDGVALIAVGGYGRGELWPYSDLDVLLLHSPSRSIDELADKLWYPVWDLGLKLGHSVGTVKQTLALAADELERATAYLDVRLIAGDAELVAGFEAGRDKLWRKRGNDLMTRLAAAVEQRHSSQGDVALRLEPDLKEGAAASRSAGARLGRTSRARLRQRSPRPATSRRRDPVEGPGRAPSGTWPCRGRAQPRRSRCRRRANGHGRWRRPHAGGCPGRSTDRLAQRRGVVPLGACPIPAAARSAAS
ncbi:MAG: nucleotidyltransferase domain-containing protein [Acidimicrobiales bacterium]